MTQTGRSPLFASAAAFVLSGVVGSAHAADSAAGQFAEWSGDGTVSRQMTGLKRDGLIELEGKRGVTLFDFEKLLLESGADADGGMID